MIIDGNEKETQAMLAFNAGDKALARKLEQEFLDELKELKASGGDHCSCKASLQASRRLRILRCDASRPQEPSSGLLS